MESFKMFVPETDVDSVERHNQLLDNIILIPCYLIFTRAVVG